MKQIYLQSFFKRGYKRLMNYISDIAHLAVSVQTEIKRRVEVIEFFDEFGLSATKKAFKVGRSTIYLWKGKLTKSGGKLSSLKSESKAPLNRKKRKVLSVHLQLVKAYRTEHPGADKVTIKPFMDASCKALNIHSVSESSIGRIIQELKDKGQIPDYQVKTSINGKTGNLRIRGTRKREHKLRIKDYKAKGPGDLVQVDAIELFINNIRRYIITALDVNSRFAFAYCYKTLSSSTAKDFFQKLEEVAPFQIKAVQTDNGKEFHKYFREYLKQRNITHFYNYPKCPKMNTYVERFNRTIQDQHISWNMHLYYEPEEANKKLVHYLTWYNTEKPHRGIGKVPPLKYFIDNFIQPKKSNMLWTAT